MEKTVKEWLDTLPKELRKDLILQQYHLNQKCGKLSDAVFYGFMWYKQNGFNDKDQAIDFWHSFHSALEYMEQLDRHDYELKK